jgi:class 3 adenylate cyclase/alpha-beta hydrolase superfamily lysophospholipase
MAVVSEVRYAKSGDINIAYQVMGEGSIDLIYLPGWMCHLEVDLEGPQYAAFADRLAAFSRFIRFDKRGYGMSDREVGPASAEGRLDDVKAVLDACGSERAALFGLSEGGPIGAAFAGLYPDRVSALVLCNTSLVFVDTEEARQAVKRLRLAIESGWGTGATAEVFAPALAANERVRAFFGRYERMTASPGTAVGYLDQWEAWLGRQWPLPPPNVPTLIVHNTGDTLVPIEAARQTAAMIPGARFVEVPGDFHLPWMGDVDLLAAEVQEFLTGVRDRPPADRMLATVLFTDIVESTTEAARLGDATWSRLLDRHDALVDRQLERFRGRRVKSTGDGVLALFDGLARAIQCACAIRDGVRGLGIDIRAGLHTGEVEGRGDDVAGIAVHVANRVASEAGPGQVLVSSTVKDLVMGSEIRFQDVGTRRLKGIPDEWRLYSVVST